jgi:hypothetical protein
LHISADDLVLAVSPWGRPLSRARRGARRKTGPRRVSRREAPFASRREWRRRMRGFGAPGAPNRPGAEAEALVCASAIPARVGHRPTRRLRARRPCAARNACHVPPSCPAQPAPPQARSSRPPGPAAASAAGDHRYSCSSWSGAVQAGNHLMPLRQLESVERRLVAPDRGVSPSPADRRPSTHCRARAGPAQPQRLASSPAADAVTARSLTSCRRGASAAGGGEVLPRRWAGPAPCQAGRPRPDLWHGRTMK